MFWNGSMLTLLLILLGTAAVFAVIRMLGVYGAATHEFQIAQAPSPRPLSVRGDTPDQLLLIAILSAAAAVELEVENVVIHDIHEVAVPHSSHEWSAQGRQMIFQSHRLRS